MNGKQPAYKIAEHERAQVEEILRRRRQQLGIDERRANPSDEALLRDFLRDMPIQYTHSVTQTRVYTSRITFGQVVWNAALICLAGYGVLVAFSWLTSPPSQPSYYVYPKGSGLFVTPISQQRYLAGGDNHFHPVPTSPGSGSQPSSGVFVPMNTATPNAAIVAETQPQSWPWPEHTKQWAMLSGDIEGASFVDASVDQFILTARPYRDAMKRHGSVCMITVPTDAINTTNLWVPCISIGR